MAGQQGCRIRGRTRRRKHRGATKVASLKYRRVLRLKKSKLKKFSGKAAGQNTVWPHLLLKWNCAYLSVSAFVLHPTPFYLRLSCLSYTGVCALVILSKWFYLRLYIVLSIVFLNDLRPKNRRNIKQNLSEEQPKYIYGVPKSNLHLLIHLHFFAA